MIDGYAKNGDIATARRVFESVPEGLKNVGTWTIMVDGYVTCAHGGFVDEGLETFSKMEKYGLTANIKHYGCLVDLLGRAGKLQDAFNLVKGMPMAPNDRVLGALLGACRIHSDTIMAENVLELVSKLNSYHVAHDDAHYLLLSSIYAASERWEMAEGMRLVFSARGSKKTAGHSALMF
ncbi:Pentatricopeptide repeat-containing protein [Sesamum alatum]|uniref:Pentatricopeptide repeat-containing protein n=1 Tax=Sesamum alatum TaxID=300844 RepID=A0AAE2CTA6_9LAMI|nr:Pentatricopeptide repeat-containing protein [Sesamum alatum]